MASRSARGALLLLAALVALAALPGAGCSSERAVPAGEHEARAREQRAEFEQYRDAGDIDNAGLAMHAALAHLAEAEASHEAAGDEGAALATRIERALGLQQLGRLQRDGARLYLASSQPADREHGAKLREEGIENELEAIGLADAVKARDGGDATEERADRILLRLCGHRLDADERCARWLQKDPRTNILSWR